MLRWECVPRHHIRFSNRRSVDSSNTTQIIYENAEMGESMVTYIELVSDCDRLRAFRIGESLRYRAGEMPLLTPAVQHPKLPDALHETVLSHTAQPNPARCQKHGFLRSWFCFWSWGERKAIHARICWTVGKLFSHDEHLASKSYVHQYIRR